MAIESFFRLYQIIKSISSGHAPLSQEAFVRFRRQRVVWVAISIAKGKVIQQQVSDKLLSITPKERQMRAHVSANIGMVMGNLAKGFDDTKFNEDLAEVERLIDEIKLFKKTWLKMRFLKKNTCQAKTKVPETSTSRFMI
jgi:hypothetical protein